MSACPVSLEKVCCSAFRRSNWATDEAAANPSQERNFLGLSTLYEIPSWEGMGVGLSKAGLN